MLWRRYEEVKGMDHWWPEVLLLDRVKTFIAEVSNRTRKDRLRGQYETEFTYTTANPNESGSKGGIRIAELDVPGR